MKLGHRQTLDPWQVKSSTGRNPESGMTQVTEKEIAALQAFEDAYNMHWGWSVDGPIDPNHPVQQATLSAIRAAYPHLLGLAYAQHESASTK